MKQAGPVVRLVKALLCGHSLVRIAVSNIAVGVNVGLFDVLCTVHHPTICI